MNPRSRRFGALERIVDPAWRHPDIAGRVYPRVPRRGPSQPLTISAGRPAGRIDDLERAFRELVDVSLDDPSTVRYRLKTFLDNLSALRDYRMTQLHEVDKRLFGLVGLFTTANIFIAVLWT